MTVESSFFHSGSEDIFAQAIERVEAGESVETVLATVPAELQTELREILLLITATHHLHRAPVPHPSAPRRAARKTAFLQAAAQMQIEMVAAESARVASAQAQSPNMIWQWLQNFWRDVQLGFAAPNLRLAPLLFILVAVWVSVFGLVRATQAAGLSDPAYPVKKWIEHQDLKLSGKEARGIIYQKITNQLIYDLTVEAAKLRQEEQETGRKAATISTETLIFEQTSGDHLLLGPLTVMMQYQPDPNVDVYKGIHMPVMPSSKEQVEVTFQIIPTEDETADPPFITQGITLTVPVEQLEIGPTPTSAPTAAPCVVVKPSGWAPYAIRDGDTLSSIAQRTGSTLAALQQVNCITDINEIVSNKNLFVPSMSVTSTPVVKAQQTVEANLTEISKTVITPSINITATVSVVPTGTAVITATETLSGVIPADATTAVTATVETTATVIGTLTPTITTTATVEAVGTITATGTVTDTLDSGTGTPEAPTVPVTTTIEVTVAADLTPSVTGSPTADGTPEGTGSSSTPSTPAMSPTPTVTPSATLFSDYTATPTPIATWTPTPEPTSTSLISGGEPTLSGESRQERSTPTSTPIPQNRSPLIGG